MISNSLEVFEPATETELAKQLARANADGLAVLPRGGGTKSDWGNPPERADLVLSTRRLDRVLEHAAGDMTVTVEAGCTIAKLQETLAKQGQRLAIDPLWPEQATVGGVLATNDNGSLRHAFGSLRDLIIGVTVALPDGTLARSGGKVVKNVAGYDLPKLMVCALGTLGVITQATFRLHPLPAFSRALLFRAPGIDAANTFILGVATSPLAVTGVEMRASSGTEFAAVGVRIEGSVAAPGAEALDAIASACGTRCLADADPAWGDREYIFSANDSAAACKVSVPQSRIADCCRALDRTCRPAAPDRLAWSLVIEGVGVGWVQVVASDVASLAANLPSLRRELAEIGGSLGVLRGPPELKGQVDSWGDVGDALPLMRRLKEQFDPSRTLNPGRFVGGI
ncbi:MAG TPA: FAD-binding oxidoreductase [Tepidisphaeraceae bacterium]|nr:FAD-binding oxidoreductase [Tepidisphaeraceae bacterium]